MTWERPSLGTRRDQDNEIDRRANLRPPYTAQEAFDKMVTHLRTQGKQAVRTWQGKDKLESICEYLTNDGLMCAVGCLLEPDKMTLHPEDLDGDVYDGLVVEALNESGYGPELFPLLRSMQTVHDHDPTTMSWEDGFRDVALTYNLTLTPRN